jgi:hypothetical protein
MSLLRKLARLAMAVAIGTMAQAQFAPAIDVGARDRSRFEQPDQRPAVVGRVDERTESGVAAVSRGSKLSAGLPADAWQWSSPVLRPRPLSHSDLDSRFADAVLASFAGRGPPVFLPTHS